jgi:TolA-binding protein
MDTLVCLNNTIWEAYANKTISQADLIYMNNHVKSCEICADVKEGIDAMLDTKLLVDKVNKVNSEVDVLIKQKNKKQPFIYYWSAAAILFISVGLFWYNTLDFKEEIALKETFKPAPKSEIELPQKDSVYNYAPPQIKENNIYNNLAEVYKPTEVKEEEIPMIQMESTADMEMVKSVESEEPQIESKVAFAAKYDTVSLARNDDLKSKENVSQKVISMASVTTTKKGKLPSIPAAVNNNAMSNNSDFISNQVINNSFIDSVNFAKAQKAFNENHFDTCINLLNNIQINHSSNYYENALYLSAQTYLKQNKKAEAKNVLNVLINLKGKKQKDAKVLLKSMKY